jgi:chemotaxis protein MotB
MSLRGANRWAWYLVALLALGGCTAQQPDRDFQLHKAEQERDALRQQVSSEQAKGVALQKKIDAADEQLSLTRADVGRLGDQVEKLTQHKQELEAVFAQLKSAALKRPEVAPSPLPSATDAALQVFASKFGERVWYDRGRGAVSFANDRLFDVGSDAVRSDAHAALHDLAGVLAQAELADYEVIVVGHTDATPITKPESQTRHPTNWHLSVHRAIAVREILEKAGLPANRLGVMGYADQRPLGSDPAQNRRVEVFVVRKGGVQPFQPVVPVRARG